MEHGPGQDPGEDVRPYWIEVTVFGKLLCMIARNDMKSGSYVTVAGSLCESKWQDKDTGANRSKVSVVLSERNGNLKCEQPRSKLASSVATVAAQESDPCLEYPF